MNQLFVNTIKMLESKNAVLADLQIRTSLLGSALGAKKTLEELKQNIETCLEVLSKDELPFNYLFVAYCYLFFDRPRIAEKYCIMAIDNFRVCGMTWNEAMGHWFLGLIHRSERRGYLYLAELNRALSIVTPIAAEYFIQGNYQAAVKREQVKSELEAQKAFAIKMGTGPLHPPAGEKQKKEERFSTNKAYLVIPWLPKYDAVRAGPNGLIWVYPPLNNSSSIHMMEIDGDLCRIYSPHTGDNRINLIDSGSYGWAKVEGQSMNASLPVPIEENDYVLFTTQWHVDVNNIVIASHHLAENDYIHMVKRYDSKNRTLISETTDTSEDYSPIIVEECQILGTVVAIAKPT